MSGDDSQQIDEAARRAFEEAWFGGKPRSIEECCPAWNVSEKAATLEELVQIEMEMLWRRGGVERGRADARIEKYLGRFPVLDRRDTVQRLIDHEFRLRQRFDPSADLGDYATRFPDYAAPTAPTIVHAPRPRSNEPAMAPPGFEIESLLGRGGMGVVYKARQLRPNRLVALKMILAQEHAGDEERRRFFQEAEAIGQLKHPNVVTIHEAGEHNSHPYLALEFVEGGTLSQEIRRQPPTAARAADVVKQLARAMHVVHQRNIIHRDLKPANVLMTPDGSPKITDFGLAKSVDAQATAGMTATGALVGTPTYMAPEQADSGDGRAVGPAADIYALGVILYEMLTGRPPFRGETIVDTLVQVRTADPVAPSRLRVNVPRDLETICLKCLHKDPRRRYASAAELADDLDRFERRLPIQARRVGAMERSALWCRRNPALAATIAIALVAVTSVASVGLYQVFEERSRFRKERDVAQANLYRALVSETNALQQARDTSWRWKAMDALRQAADLDVADRDPRSLRDLTIRVLGSEFPCVRERATIGDGVTCVAIRPDGGVAMTGSNDGVARLWSIPDGTPAGVLSGHGGAITGAAYHPAGRWLAIASGDNKVRIWDPAAGADSPAQVFDFGVRAGCLEFAPDGSLLAVGSLDGNVHLLALDPATAAELGKRRVLKTGAGAVRCLGFAPAGISGNVRIAASMASGAVRIWDAGSGQELDGWIYGNATNSFVFSGNSFISSDLEDNALRLRNLATNQIHFEGRSNMHGVRRLRGDARGRLVVAQDDGVIKWWYTPSSGFREAAVARGAWGAALDFALDGSGEWMVARYSDGKARIWEVNEPAERTVLRDNPLQRAPFLGASRLLAAHGVIHDFSPGAQAWKSEPFTPAWASALAIHPDGKSFAHGRHDGALAITRLFTRPNEAAESTAEPTVCERQVKAIVDLASDDSGERFASASADGLVKLWDWRTGACLLSLDPDLGSLHSIAWSGSRLAASGDRGVAWCDPSERRWRVLQSRGLSASCVALRGDTIAFTTTGGFEVRDLADPSRRLVKTQPSPTTALALSPDGTLVAGAARGEDLRVWNAETGAEWATLVDSTIDGKTSGAWLAFHPDGRTLAAETIQHVQLFDVREKAPVAIFNSYMARRGRFTPAGDALLVTATSSIRRCTMAEVEQARSAFVGKTGLKSGAKPASRRVVVQARDIVSPGGHTDAIWGMASSPDGRWIATASHDKTVKLWDARKRTLVRTLEGHGAIVWCVAFSPDSKQLASGSANAKCGEIKVWDVETGRQLRDFCGHNALVMGVAFHPRRPWLVSSANDGTVHLWDVEADRPLGQLHKFSGTSYSVAFRPDGKALAATSGDRQVALWDVAADSLPAGPPTRTLTGGPGGFYAVAFSPDSRLLAGGSEQGAVLLWNADDGARLATLTSAGGQIRDLSFSRDGELLSTAAYLAPIIVWDLARLRRGLGEMNLDW